MVRQAIGTSLSRIMVKLLQAIINFQKIKPEDVTKPTPSPDIQLMTVWYPGELQRSTP